MVPAQDQDQTSPPCSPFPSPFVLRVRRYTVVPSSASLISDLFQTKPPLGRGGHGQREPNPPALLPPPPLGRSRCRGPGGSHYFRRPSELCDRGRTWEETGVIGSAPKPAAARGRPRGSRPGGAGRALRRGTVPAPLLTRAALGAALPPALQRSFSARAFLARVARFPSCSGNRRSVSTERGRAFPRLPRPAVAA